MIEVSSRRLKRLLTSSAGTWPGALDLWDPAGPMLPADVNCHVRLRRAAVVAEGAIQQGIRRVAMHLPHVLREAALLNEALAAAFDAANVFHLPRVLLHDVVIHSVGPCLGLPAFRADIEACVVLGVLGSRHPTGGGVPWQGCQVFAGGRSRFILSM